MLRDPLMVMVEDVRLTTHEARFTVTGMSSRCWLLIVVIADAWPDTGRIISARRPTRRERHAYEDSKG